jgi:hypothetical protein
MFDTLLSRFNQNGAGHQPLYLKKRIILLPCFF